MSARKRIIVTLLSLTVSGLAAWQANEGDGPVIKDSSGTELHVPYIPTKGDVPTIGNGSTRYEDGTPVKLTDPPITRKRATELAINLMSKDEQAFKASIPGVELYPEEFDLYMDFYGQFGGGNWRISSMRTDLLAGNYVQACHDLLKWRKQAGRDCSLPQNWGPKGCKGVWTRQQQRYAKCMAAQVAQ